MQIEQRLLERGSGVLELRRELEVRLERRDQLARLAFHDRVGALQRCRELAEQRLQDDPRRRPAQRGDRADPVPRQRDPDPQLVDAHLAELQHRALGPAFTEGLRHRPEEAEQRVRDQRVGGQLAREPLPHALAQADAA